MQMNLFALMGKNRYTIQEAYEKKVLSHVSISMLYHYRVTRIDFEAVEKLCNLFKRKLEN